MFKKEHNYFLFILASERNGALYIGVTNNLFVRGFQHKLKENKESFTPKYGVEKLWVYSGCDFEREVDEEVGETMENKFNS